jgi:hypothetical protein
MNHKISSTIAFGILLVLIISSLSVVAETNIMRIDFSLADDGKVRLINVENSRGTYEVANFSTSNFIEIVDDDVVKYYLPFEESFYRLTDLPSIVEEKLVTKKLPYLGSRGKLNFYKDGDLQLTFDLEELCDLDGKCTGYENKINCPYDCEPNYMEQLEKRRKERKLAEQLKTDLLNKQKENLEKELAQRNRERNFMLLMAIIGMVLLFTLYIILHKGIKHHKEKNGRK